MPSYTRAYIEYIPENGGGFACWAVLSTNSNEWRQASLALGWLEAAGKLVHVPVDPQAMSDAATSDFWHDTESFRESPQPSAFSFSVDAEAEMETRNLCAVELMALIAAFKELGESARLIMWTCG